MRKSRSISVSSADYDEYEALLEEVNNQLGGNIRMPGLVRMAMTLLKQRRQTSNSKAKASTIGGSDANSL